jgi:uncharacterized membrane protein (Fun14 family)
MNDIIPSMIFQLGLGGLGGFIIGYALKKISKIVLVLIGLFIIALVYLGMKGIISINYDALLESISGLLGMAYTASSLLVQVLALVPFAGSFITGFLIGLKLG